MIKKLYLSLILLTAIFLFNALPACALDGVEWGIFEDYTIKPNKYAFNKIFNNEPIRYYILTETDKNSNEPLEKNENVDNLENLATSLENTMEAEKITHNFSKGIENAFIFWFEGTKNMIIKDGRQEEFADIMPILSKKIKLRRTRNLEQADIVFNFVYDIKRHCSQNVAGCIRWEKHNNEEKTSYAYVRIPNPLKNTKNYSEDKVFHVLTHEIGHYFGLTDQYYRENYKKNYTIYNNPRIGYKKSKMDASYKIGLDCDDVDGFINLIDLSLSGGNINNFSARAQKGWSSFCNGKNEYFLDTYYRNAQPVKQTVANWIKTPFNAYGRTLTYDDKGRILNTTDGINRYTFNYTETEKDNFISAFRNEKEFKVEYGKDELDILSWNGKGNKFWSGSYSVFNNEEKCEISYASKRFSIMNGECDVENLGNNTSHADTNKYLKNEEDFNKIRFIKSENQRENKILQEHICPFIQTECSFFKKIYESMK